MTVMPMTEKRKLKTSWDDHYMLVAYLGCLSWVLSEDEVLEAFRKETENNWKPPKYPLGKAIDHATGIDFVFIQGFSDFVESNIFGTSDDLTISDKP